MSQTGHNLQKRLLRSFFIQAVLISIMTVVGVYSAKLMIEDVLMRKALQGEAEHFWNRYRQDPSIDRPDTLNLLGYLAENHDVQQVPEELRSLQPGMQRAPFDGSEPIIYVEDQAEGRIYLIFDEVNVSRLTVLFGVLPLTLVLIGFYFLSWFSYRQSHRAVSPIIQLAKRVEAARLDEGKWLEIDTSDLGTATDTEVISLVKAINHFAERLGDFIERERDFTRDASHELRTPIAVLNSALAVIERKYEGQGDKTIERMQRTLHDMESLIETLLLIARENPEPDEPDTVLLNDIISSEVDSLQSLYAQKPVSVEISEDNMLALNTPPRVLHILVGNLVRNAYNYTPDGSIKIHIKNNSLYVEDSGVGMDKQQLDKVFNKGYRGGQLPEVSGHGLGMSIVKRLSNRYGWRVSVTSKVGEGTRIKVTFPNGRPR